MNPKERIEKLIYQILDDHSGDTWFRLVYAAAEISGTLINRYCDSETKRGMRSKKAMIEQAINVLRVNANADEENFISIVVARGDNDDRTNQYHAVISEKYEGKCLNQFDGEYYFQYMVPTCNATACIEELTKIGALILKTGSGSEGMATVGSIM